VIPDRPGNKRLDGMRNILGNPNIGLLFLVPGRDETLRVNGRAWLTCDPDILARASVNGKAPLVAIGVEVEEVFMHCGKASVRASLWQTNRWPDTQSLPSSACMLLDHARPDGMTLERMEARLADGKTQLY
jgi:predicted pyridoxine 5'-phosphate oxidase superfamily flavin-nucleotide-binding protein